MRLGSAFPAAPGSRPIWLRFALALLFVGGLGAARAAESAVLLAAATDAELQPILARLSAVESTQIAGWQIWRGQLGRHPVLLTRTEGDPLNAVAATTLAIRRYSPGLVVTYGSARPHDPALQAGDVVVSGSFAAFDGILSDPLPLGAGSDPLRWSRLPHAVMTRGGQEHYQDEFPADVAALERARRLQPARGKLVVGVLGSANQVNREADRVAWIRRTWKTSCEDFDSAHVAGTALVLDVPVIGIRVIDGTPDEAAALALQFLEGQP